MNFQSSTYTILLFLMIIGASCKKAVSAQDVTELNGYWEINFVVLPDGTRKSFTVNETVELIELNQGKGLRKKVKPQFDGSFLNAGGAEKISVEMDGERTLLTHEAAFSEWSEEIVSVTGNELVLKSDSLEYHYRKFVPFDIK